MARNTVTNVTGFSTTDGRIWASKPLAQNHQDVLDLRKLLLRVRTELQETEEEWNISLSALDDLALCLVTTQLGPVVQDFLNELYGT